MRSENDSIFITVLKHFGCSSPYTAVPRKSFFTIGYDIVYNDHTTLMSVGDGVSAIHMIDAMNAAYRAGTVDSTEYTLRCIEDMNVEQSTNLA